MRTYILCTHDNHNNNNQNNYILYLFSPSEKNISDRHEITREKKSSNGSLTFFQRRKECGLIISFVWTIFCNFFVFVDSSKQSFCISSFFVISGEKKKRKIKNDNGTKKNIYTISILVCTCVHNNVQRNHHDWRDNDVQNHLLILPLFLHTFFSCATKK